MKQLTKERISNAILYLCIALIVFFGFLFLTACNSINEVEESSGISGKYQSVDYEGDLHNGYDIELTLIHTYRTVSGTGRFNTSHFSFNGTSINNHFELVFTLIYQGFIYSVKLDLFYSDKTNPIVLANGIDLGSGTQAIRFKLLEKIDLHDQGGIR